MTPKEKAKELLEKFIEPTKIPNVKGIWENDLDTAKQCALICVDEISILQVLRSTKLASKIDGYFESDSLEYWEEVKKEIELL